MFKYKITPKIGIIRRAFAMGRRTNGYARVLFLNINNIFTLKDKKIIKGG